MDVGNDEDASRHGGEKKQPLVVSGFEFVLMGMDGALSKKGISQIRAHTTRELHRSRRQNGQALERRRRNRPAGNIFFGAQIDPFHALPQLPIEDSKPGFFDEIKHNVFIVYNQKTMQEHIWPQGTKDGTFFTGMLLMCSVHLDGLSARSSSAITTALKVESMRLVRGSIQDESRNAIMASISAIACLATCALVRGELEGAQEYLMHRKAYAVLIKEANQMNMFKDSRFCKDVLRIITVIAISRRCGIPTSGLAPPVDTGSLLQEYEHVFEDRWRSRDAPELALYSPLYDGREDPCADPFPHVAAEHLRLLLEMMQSVVKMWLEQKTSTSPYLSTNSTILSSLLHQVLSMPSARESSLPCSNDHVYEACRLVSVLLIKSVETGRHWRSVAAGTLMLQDIRDALERTNIDGLWDKQIGLFYYVALIYHSAAFNTPQYPFGHVLSARIHFELTYNYNDWHGALIPMGALQDLLPDDSFQQIERRLQDAKEMADYTSDMIDTQTTAGLTCNLFPIVESND